MDNKFSQDFKSPKHLVTSKSVYNTSTIELQKYDIISIINNWEENVFGFVINENRL